MSTSASLRASYAAKITTRIRESVEAVLDVGRLVLEAKAALPHGEFEAMVRDDLEWSPQTARKLMAIARHPVLSDRVHVRDLPATWGTLAELARVAPEQLERAIEAGLVRPGMKRRDAREIAAGANGTSRGAELERDAGDAGIKHGKYYYAISGAASDEEFEAAIAAAKAEGDLSRENLVRKLTGAGRIQRCSRCGCWSARRIDQAEGQR